MESSEFYLRYYVGHRGKHGTEFLEFECKSTGRVRYANNSHYRNEPLIRKEVNVSSIVLGELKEIVDSSGIMERDDTEWPEPNALGRQELEIINGGHICFITSQIGSFLDVQASHDPEGLKTFYYLVQDLKCFVFSLINLHFRVKPF